MRLLDMQYRDISLCGVLMRERWWRTILIASFVEYSIVKGAYCLVIEVDRPTRVRVGSLGVLNFPVGTYVYVGSAQNGIEQRVGRHMSKVKKKHWHIDYLLAKASIVYTVSLPCPAKDYECEVARTLAHRGGGRATVRGFGSSDCSCESHLLFFGEKEPEDVAELLTLSLSMLECVYPRRVRA